MKNGIRRSLLVLFSVFALSALLLAGCNDNTTEEKLLIGVEAAGAVEVNTEFKPEVTVAEGAEYKLIVTGAPSGAEIPAVANQAFVPDALGEYSYKITVEKEGSEAEEHSGKVTAVDTTAPVIAGDEKTFEIARGDKLVFSTMIDNLSVTDNYDSSVGSLVFDRIMKGDETIDTADGSTEYTFTSAGVYSVYFTVSDSSANEAEAEIVVTVSGLDVSDTSPIELFIGDTLLIPEYTVIPEGSGTVTLLLDGTEISASNLPSFNEVGDHTLTIEYYLNGNESETADETVEIDVTVSDITVSAVVDAEGKEAGFVSQIPQPAVNDPKAEVSVTLQKPGGNAEPVTPLDEVTYGAAGYYTYVFKATKGSIERTFTHEFYVKTAGEVLTFENVAGGSTWDGSTGVEPVLTEEQAKYGKKSLKMELAQEAYGEATWNNGPVIGKAYNSVSLWIYSSAATELRLGLAQNEESNWWLLNPDDSESFAVAEGWNEIKLFIKNNEGKGQIATLRLTNIGASAATVYVDAVGFFTDNYIVEKNATKEIVKNSKIDLNAYFEIFGMSEAVQVSIVAEKGTVSLREYTAPAEPGTDTVTITVTETGKTTRELVLRFTIISVSFSVPDDYDAYYDVGSTLELKQTVIKGAVNPVIKAELSTSEGKTTIVGDSFIVNTMGWTEVIYTMTCDNESEPIVVSKEFYVRAVGESFSFEDYATSGKDYDNILGSSADIAAPVVDTEFAKYGRNSMKFVLGAGQQAMLNYATSEQSPKPSEYNTIRVFIHSDKDSAVRLGIAQNNTDKWWFIDPNSSNEYQVKTGWTEIAISVAESMGLGDVAALALTNCGSEEGVFHIDALRFLTEMIVVPSGASTQVPVGAEIDLANLITVSESADYTVAVKVNDDVLVGTKYTFDEESEYTVTYTVTDTASGLVKELSLTVNAVTATIAVEDYANALLNDEITVKGSVVAGADKNVSVKLYLPDGSDREVQEDGKFIAEDGGWYRLVYTLTYGESLTKSVEKSFYVGYAGELASFEDIPRNGQSFSIVAGNVATSTEQAHFGNASLKFTNENKDARSQITYDGNPTSGNAPIITDNSFNKVKLWVYSETAVRVTIGIQGGGSGDNWGWITSPNDVIELQAGWQELTIDRGSDTSAMTFDYIASILVDKKTEGTDGTAESIYLDCIRFVNE